MYLLYLEDDINNITLYAITRESSPLEIISNLNLIVDKTYNRLYPKVRGLVVLSTCSRFEVYIDSSSSDSIIEDLTDIIGDASRYINVYRGIEAVRHLFEVSSGIKSQFIGEFEILGQVKNAWLKAKSLNYTTWLLDKIFHRAVISGRRARKETRIGYGTVGYPQVAMELLSSKLGGINGKSILIIGAGQASESALKHLCSKYKPSRVIIANRTIEKAYRLASLCPNSIVIGIGEIHSVINGIDGVFIAISGGVKLFNYDDIIKLNKPIIDISLPPVTSRVEGLTYTFDDISRISQVNLEVRLAEIPKVNSIIEEEIRNLYKDIARFKAKNTINDIMKLASNLYMWEVHRTIKSLRNGSELKDSLLLSFDSYLRKVLRPLVLYIYDKYLQGDERIALEIYSYFNKELRRLSKSG